MSPSASHVKELAQRRSDNLEVTLFWDRQSERVWISVYDSASEEQFSKPVPGAQALDAFNHPYAYLAA
jgi:hypothetical protein